MVSVEGTLITYNNTFFENPKKNVDRQVLPVNIFSDFWANSPAIYPASKFHVTTHQM